MIDFISPALTLLMISGLWLLVLFYAFRRK